MLCAFVVLLFSCFAPFFICFVPCESRLYCLLYFILLKMTFLFAFYMINDKFA